MREFVGTTHGPRSGSDKKYQGENLQAVAREREEETKQTIQERGERIHELDIGPGDTFVFEGDTYEVDSVTENGWLRCTKHGRTDKSMRNFDPRFLAAAEQKESESTGKVPLPDNWKDEPL